MSNCHIYLYKLYLCSLILYFKMVVLGYGFIKNFKTKVIHGQDLTDAASTATAQ